MEYAVMAGGKRLRPVLCLASSEAVSGGSDGSMPAACALEMIHTYSLIHDDLPALDNDDLRRGKATCHNRFGEATAILTGDAFLNMAFELLAETGFNEPAGSTVRWIAVIRVIAKASGCRGMLDGQARDLAFEGVKLQKGDLEALHRLKTGALILASVHCGAILGGASPEQIGGLKRYAKNIGLAFQVVDDILDVTGDPKIMGKAAGSDMKHGKNTYPSLMGLDASRHYAGSLVDDALQALRLFDNKADPLREIAAYIIHRQR
jgi:geranylgeranyl diphosphate synthase type II